MLDEPEEGLWINLSSEGFDKAFGKESQWHPMVSNTLMTYAKLKQMLGEIHMATDFCEKAIVILREKFTLEEQQAHKAYHHYQHFYNGVTSHCSNSRKIDRNRLLLPCEWRRYIT